MIDDSPHCMLKQAFRYSVLTQPSGLGPRSFPLTGLASLSHDLRERVIKLLRSPLSAKRSRYLPTPLPQ